MSSRTGQSSFNTRSSLLTVFLFLLFCVVVYRLFVLQVLDGGEFREQADAQHSIYQKLLPSRGQIELVDSASSLDTVPLATNSKSYLVYAVPGEVANANLTATSLANVLGLDSK